MSRVRWPHHGLVSRLINWLGVALLATAAWTTGGGRAGLAQEKPPAVTPPAVAPLAVESPPAGETIIREQTIYIPYTKLRETFERDGRGVFLPYEQFQTLWKAAQAGKLLPPEEKPPTGFLISEIDSNAAVERDVVKITAKLKIELLTEGWHRVPLRLGDSAILSAKLGDVPAHVIFDRDGYYLLVRHPGSKPATPPAGAPPIAPVVPAPDVAAGVAPVPAVTAPTPAAPGTPPYRFELSLEYAKAFVKNPGQNSVSVEAPQAPINRWQIRVPQAGAKVTVSPLIAATEGPSSKPEGKPDAKPGTGPAGKTPAPAGESTLLAFVGSAPTVRIEWTVKAEGASGLAALVNVQARQDVRIEEGVLRTTGRLTYEITRAELSQLQIEVPVDQKVVNVFDANVRGWEVKTEGETQKITVQLFQPVKGNQNVVVELEKFLAEMNQKSLMLPVIKALDVGRQQGIYLVYLAPELRAEVVRRTGLTQLDAAEPMLASEATRPTFPFRYATLPIDLVLSIERVKPRIVVKELVEAYLESDHLTVDLLALYEIEKAGVFQLELDLPEGFEVRRVVGHTAAGFEAVAVESHQLSGDKKTHLVVNLSRKAIGKIGLAVGLEKKLNDPNLLSPTGAASTFNLVMPRVSPTGVERSEGKAVIFAPEGLRVNPTTLTGLRVVSVQEANQGTESMRAGRFPLTREVFAFAYGPSPVELVMTAERRKPAITARQLMTVRVESGVVKYDATFFYDIRFSGVKQLRLDVPQELASKLHNETPQIREKPIDKPEPAPAKGYVAWSLTGETELLGQTSVRFSWEQPLEELKVGNSREVTIPRLSPQGAELERSHGQLVIAKSESLDIRPASEPEGLRSIDPQHDLMPEAAGKDWARAFEFQADWSLKLAVERYQLEEVKRTSIELGVVRMVVTRGGETAVQAVYRLRSAHQRLAFKLPESYKLDTQPLRINGQFQALERGENDELFAPLLNRTSGETLLVELRYTVPRGASRLDLPEFLKDPAVQQIYLCAYLPNDWALLGWYGDWTDEFHWFWSSPTEMIPVARQSDQQLMARVLEGVAGVASPATNFPIDGTLFTFSTLRPESPPKGSLHLVAMRRDWMHGCSLVVLVLFGLAMLTRPLVQRLFAFAVMVASIVILGIFLPTFTRQVCDGAFVSVALLVLVLWLVVSLVKIVRQVRWTRTIQSTSPSLATAGATAGATNIDPAPSPFGASAAASSSPVGDASSASVDSDKPSSSENGGSDHA